MKISRNTVATVSFIVTDSENKVVGRTDPKRPVVTLVGHHYLVPGLEKAIDGHEKGDEFALTLNPAESYGEFEESLVQTIPRSMFGDFPLEVGQVFEADSTMGIRPVVVKEIRDEEVVVDGNHPLAGQTLNFFVCIEDVRAATEEEIAHGHAHPEGKCPSEQESHCCCGGHHHDEEEGEHHCCCGHHHDDDDSEHKCCGGHHHDEEEGEHHCCCGHHHDDDDSEHKCCGGHHHDKDEGEHHCCCGHHHDK